MTSPSGRRMHGEAGGGDGVGGSHQESLSLHKCLSCDRRPQAKDIRSISGLHPLDASSNQPDINPNYLQTLQDVPFGGKITGLEERLQTTCLLIPSCVVHFLPTGSEVW